MNESLFLGDCFQILPTLKEASVDLILVDPPYNLTAASWDVRLSLNRMWFELKRIRKPKAPCIFFGTEPFSSELRISNFDEYKYDWYWKKTKPNGWQHSKNKPMTVIETISVFCDAPIGHVSLLGDKRMSYFPQGVRDSKIKKVQASWHGELMGSRDNQTGKEYVSQTGFPNNLLEYPNITGTSCLHSTQKPVELLKFLIKSYTKEEAVVLDFCMGSGSTAIACLETNRNFIGIEKEEKFFQITKQRIEKHKGLLNV